jgi:hypothetical protein
VTYRPSPLIAVALVKLDALAGVPSPLTLDRTMKLHPLSNVAATTTTTTAGIRRVVPTYRHNHGGRPP